MFIHPLHSSAPKGFLFEETRILADVVAPATWLLVGVTR
jgi:hypothetical protein